MLTGADLCAAAKPWDAQYPTAMDIFSELYDQVIIRIKRVGRSHNIFMNVFMHCTSLIISCCLVLKVEIYINGKECTSLLQKNYINLDTLFIHSQSRR